MGRHSCLCDLQPGESGLVKELRLAGSQRRRLLDIGLVNNTLVECLFEVR